MIEMLVLTILWAVVLSKLNDITRLNTEVYNLYKDMKITVTNLEDHNAQGM
jgi:hypothetical protein